MNYGGINYTDSANGEGWRVTLFVSGCKFHCKDCQNKEVQEYSYGEKFEEITKQMILSRIKSPIINGLSLSGGDPLWQSYSDIMELTNLCKEVHKVNKNVWIWSGFTWNEIFIQGETTLDNIARQNLISNCDVFIDGLFKADKKDLSLAWRGSSNQRVIDVQKTLEFRKTNPDSKEIVLYTE